jgi:hypothetical protein
MFKARELSTNYGAAEAAAFQEHVRTQGLKGAGI